MREQLFNAWKSFHFNENADIRFKCHMYKIDSYIIRLCRTTCIRCI